MSTPSCDRCGERCLCTIAGRCGAPPASPQYCAGAPRFDISLGGHIALDVYGRLYVAQTRCDQILRLDSNGITLVAGGKTEWLGQRYRPGDSVDAAGFSQLGGITLGPKGEVYVAELGMIRVVENQTIRILAGSVTSGFEDGPALQAGFVVPGTLALDTAEALYVADDQSRIRLVADDQVTTLAGSRQSGHVDGPADTARFGDLLGLARVGDAVYVSDGNTIRRLQDGLVTTVAGQDGSSDLYRDGPVADARFNNPRGLTVDPRTGELLVADTGNRRLRAIDLKQGTVRTLTLYAGTFLAPTDVAVARDGQIYVMDLGCVRVLRR